MAAIRKSVKLVLGGLFNIDVNVLGAVDADDKETAFKNLCLGKAGDPAHPPAPVRQRLECVTCSNDDRESFSKGREVSKGSYIVVDPDELAAADVDEELQVQMQLTVHDAADVERQTLPGEKVYFLEPGKGPLTVKAYNLLHDKIVENPGKAICTVWAARTKPGMFRLGAYNGALTIEQLAWPENVRSAPRVEHSDYSEQDGAMFDQLMTMITADFDPATYRDARKDQIAALVAAAQAVDGVAADKPAKAGAKPAATVDLSSALSAALAAAGAAPAATPAKKATAAKKAPAKKAAAKKPDAPAA